MDDRILTEMPLDELGVLHQSVATILVSEIRNRKSKLEDRLRQLRADAARPPRTTRSPSKWFRRSFVIWLSRTKHGPDEAIDRAWQQITQCWSEPNYRPS